MINTTLFSIYLTNKTAGEKDWMCFFFRVRMASTLLLLLLLLQHYHLSGLFSVLMHGERKRQRGRWRKRQAEMKKNSHNIVVCVSGKKRKKERKKNESNIHITLRWPTFGNFFFMALCRWKRPRSISMQRFALVYAPKLDMGEEEWEKETEQSQW